MKTYDSKQSQFIQKIVELYNPYVLILSATPQNKQYIDLYPQYKVLGSKIFNISAKEFKKKYCIETPNYNLVFAGKASRPYNEITGYRNIEEMNKEIANYTYYKKYESEYEKPIDITQKFKITSDMKYFKNEKIWPRMNEMEFAEKILLGKEITDEYIIAKRPALHHIYMRECCSGFITENYRLKDNPKLQWLDDFIDGNEGRFVVFTNFIEETKIIQELCNKKKRHSVIYDGSHKDLTDWHKFDDCIAIVNVAAGSAGLNDFVLTNIAIYFSPPENYIDFVQSKGRIDRIGQTKQPVYYYLEMSGSVEPAIYLNLANGKNFDSACYEQWLKLEESKKEK